MELEWVGYRFSSVELSVLMALQGYQRIGALPDIQPPTEEQFKAGMATLEQADILNVVGGSVLMDQVYALLIANLCQCAHFVSAAGKGNAAVLCHCGEMGMLLQALPRGSWVMTVAQTEKELREAFLAAVNGFDQGGSVRVNGAPMGTAANQVELNKLAGEALALWPESPFG